MNVAQGQMAGFGFMAGEELGMAGMEDVVRSVIRFVLRGGEKHRYI